MSPLVLMLPVMCRSCDRVDAGGFGFGAAGLDSAGLAGGDAGIAEVGAGAEASAAGAMEHAVMTDKASITADARRRLDIMISKYLG